MPELEPMRYIDPHIHMVSRTTDDYQAMRDAGVVAVIEPAFWIGQPRTTVGTFQDYFSSLVGWERFRASQFGIHHYCTIGPQLQGGQQRRPRRPGHRAAAALAGKEGWWRSARSASTT